MVTWGTMKCSTAYIRPPTHMQLYLLIFDGESRSKRPLKRSYCDGTSVSLAVAQRRFSAKADSHFCVEHFGLRTMPNIFALVSMRKFSKHPSSYFPLELGNILHIALWKKASIFFLYQILLPHLRFEGIFEAPFLWLILLQCVLYSFV